MWSSTAGRALAVTALFAALAVAGTWPHAAHLSSTVLGEGTDVLLGIRYLWALDEQGGNPFTTERDFLVGHPEGVSVGRALNVGNVLFVGTVWVLGQWIGWLTAFNLYNLFGLVFAGTTAYLLLERLRFGVLPALFGAYVFAFNPNHVEKALGHVPLTATWILPLVLIALLRKRERPTIRASLLAGALVVVAFYLNSYLGLFALWLTCVFAAVELVLRRSGTSAYEVVRSYYFAAVVWVFGMLPVALSWWVDRESVSVFERQRSGEFLGGGASAQLYLLPSPRHPLFGEPMSDWLSTHLSWEFTMFFGYTTIVLAVVGVALAVIRRRRRTLSREEGALVLFACALVVTSIWASLPPDADLFGIDVPTLGGLLRDVTSVYRVYSRFGVLVGLGLIILAGYALAALPRRGLRAGLAGLALVVVAAELYVGPPRTITTDEVLVATNTRELSAFGSGRFPVLDATRPVPSYLAWLRSRPRGVVADYPHPGSPDGRWAWEDYVRQQDHRQPLWQSPQPSPFLEGVQGLADDLGSARTPSVLSAVGVRYAVVHAERYRRLDEDVPRVACGLERVATFERDEVAIYRVTAPPAARFASFTSGLYERNPLIWPEDQGLRWMGSSSTVALFAPQDEEVFLAGNAVSIEGPRRLDVLDAAGRSMGAWEILPTQTFFRLPLRVHRGLNLLRIRAGLPKRRSSTDPRLVTIAFSPLTVQAPGEPNPEPCEAEPSETGRKTD